MPYKDINKKKEYMRDYQKNLRSNMSFEEKEIVKEKNRFSKKIWYESMSPEEKSDYLEKNNAKIRARYASDASIRLGKKEASYEMYRKKRNEVIEHLGGRCSSPQCTSINPDGSQGCLDHRCLQIDHVKGDGSKLRKDNSSERGTVFYNKVLKTIPGEDYQLLCANCNWIKRDINKELPQSRATDNSYIYVKIERPKDELGRFVKMAGV